MHIQIKNLKEILRDTFYSFGQDKIMKLSAALAYYTIFSMAPLLVVIISLSSMFFSREAIEGEVYGALINFIGSDSAIQVQNLIKNTALQNKSTLALIISVGVLLLGATSIFSEIQDSINIIWGLKAKPKKNWVKYLQNRFLSFSVIVSLGFLLLVSLLLSSVFEIISKNLSTSFPETTIILFYAINLLLTIVISTIVIGTIFKVLPDAKIAWKDIMAGSIVTAVLFLIGKFAISFYITKTDIGSAFGAAGSLIVLLVWAYYSAVILYLGAEFTKVFAIKFGNKILPNNYAVKIEQVEVEVGTGAIT